jgi:two-component system response regulator FixJ
LAIIIKPKPIVYIIDDDQHLRTAIQILLESVGLGVETFDSSASFLPFYHPRLCGCIIADVRMPEMSGMQLLEKLNALKSRLPFIIVTAYGDIAMAVQAMKLGAVDFILKPFNNQTLIEQVQKSVAKNVNDSASDAMNTSAKGLQTLSKREHQVLEHIVDGKLNKQIADELKLSVGPIEFHRSRLMKKIGAKNLAHLIKIYITYKTQNAI